MLDLLLNPSSQISELLDSCYYIPSRQEAASIQVDNWPVSTLDCAVLTLDTLHCTALETLHCPVSTLDCPVSTLDCAVWTLDWNLFNLCINVLQSRGECPKVHCSWVDSGSQSATYAISRYTSWICVIPTFIHFWHLKKTRCLLKLKTEVHYLLVPKYFLNILAIHSWIKDLRLLDGRARYAGLLKAPAESFGQRFFALWAKKEAFDAVCAYFRQFLVFSSNLHNF